MPMYFDLRVFIKIICFLGAGSIAFSPPILAQAQTLDVPIIEKADEGLDTCALGEVHGLKKDGDGFLAVRSGPDTGNQQIDRVVNGDRVWVFNQSGDWYGVVYGVDEVDCSPVEQDVPVRADGKKGWVHSGWVRIIAG